MISLGSRFSGPDSQVRIGHAISKLDGVRAHFPPAPTSFCIEDPLEVTRDLGAHLTPGAFAVLRAEFLRAHTILDDGSHCERLTGAGDSIGREGVNVCCSSSSGGGGDRRAPEAIGHTRQWVNVLEEMLAPRLVPHHA